MARRLPQPAVVELRRLDFDIAAGLELAPQVTLERAPERPPLGMPVDHAGRVFLLVEQVHLAAELAMVALLGFLDAVQILLQLLVGEEDRAVDALELGVLGIAAPVGARHLRELERLAELARRRQVRTKAHVEPVALAIDRDHLVLGQSVGPLGLEALAVLLEVVLDLGAVPNLARNRQITIDDLGHALLDLGEVLRREGLDAHEVVVEPVLGRRTERDLRAGIEFLDCLRQHVRRVVAQEFERFRIARRHDADLGVVIDDAAEVHHLAVDAQRQRCLGETGADRCRDIGAAHRLFERSDRPVR